jgi:hypothetical protein
VKLPRKRDALLDQRLEHPYVLQHVALVEVEEEPDQGIVTSPNY